MTDLVSIIMPAFNSEKFIDESIKSVVDQTYESWELIICSDNSNDNTDSLVKNWCAIDSRIKLVKNTHNKGAPGARNSCLDNAKGRFIAFLDSDDIWLPNKLHLQVNFMLLNKYEFTYSYHEVMNENGKIISRCMAPKLVNIKSMKFSNFIPCLTVIYDASVIGRVYQPDIRKRNDYALWLKILNKKKSLNAFCFKQYTARYRANSYGLSSNKLTNFKYFYKCLIRYGDCNYFNAFLYSCAYLAIMVFKKKFSSLYNLLVIKI
jgi:glycosyltransferase involved in cell wall biosynthesis